MTFQGRFSDTLLWQGLAIALLAVSLASLFGKNSSKTRYGIYVTSLLAMVLSLGVTYALVDVSIPQVAERYQADTIPIDLEPSVTLPEANLPETTQPSSVSLTELSSDTKAVEAPEPTVSPKFHLSLDWQRYTPYLISLYLLGAVVMLGRLLLGLQGGQQLRKFSEPVEDAAILASLRQQARALGLTFIPAIAFCRRVIVPTVVGVFKPTILLPFSFASGLSPQQIEMLLAHELAHIRRYDPLVNIVQRVIEAVLFFHPAVWFISRRIRIERENCCDDMVLEIGGKATEYASSLVDVAQQTLLAASKQRLATEGVSAAGQPSRLGDRVRRLMGTPKSQKVRLKHTWVIGLLLVLALVIPMTIAMSSSPSRDKDISAVQVGRLRGLLSRIISATSRSRAPMLRVLDSQTRKAVPNCFFVIDHWGLYKQTNEDGIFDKDEDHFYVRLKEFQELSLWHPDYESKFLERRRFSKWRYRKNRIGTVTVLLEKSGTASVDVNVALIVRGKKIDNEFCKIGIFRGEKAGRNEVRKAIKPPQNRCMTSVNYNFLSTTIISSLQLS